MGTISSSTFKFYDSFNLFIFSRTPEGETQFLLRKKHYSQGYIHMKGTFQNNEPSIIVAAALEVRRRTNGLLCSQNLKYFRKQDPVMIPDQECIITEKHTIQTKPQRILTPVMNEICQQICESPYHFQDDTNTVTYFVEIPYIDLEKLHEVAESKQLQHKYKYFRWEDIINYNLKEVDHDLQIMVQSNSNLKEYARKYILSNKPVKITKYYGVICCEMFMNTYMLHALYFATFKKHGENWRFYRAFEKDLPTDDELKRLNGLIIPGSSCSVYNSNVDWYQGLFEVIRKVNDQYSNIKLLGICFGAQVIAQALGGRVEKMPRDIVDGGELLTIKPDFFELSFVKNANIDSGKQLVIAKAHNDHIVELPMNARHYASSKSTNVEIYMINDNILGIQGHPDYNQAVACSASFAKTGTSVRSYAKFEEQCIKSKFPTPLTQKEMLKICYNFIKHS